LWLLSAAVWTAAVERAAADCRRTLLKPFFTGLPVTIVAVIAVTNLGKLGGPGGMAAVASFAFYIVFASIGVAGLASVLGARLRPGATQTRSIITGGIVLELAFVFPLAGWFFVLPITLITGSGAALRALVRRSSA